MSSVQNPLEDTSAEDKSAEDKSAESSWALSVPASVSAVAEAARATAAAAAGWDVDAEIAAADASAEAEGIDPAGDLAGLGDPRRMEMGRGAVIPPRPSGPDLPGDAAAARMEAYLGRYNPRHDFGEFAAAARAKGGTFSNPEEVARLGEEAKAEEMAALAVKGGRVAKAHQRAAKQDVYEMRYGSADELELAAKAMHAALAEAEAERGRGGLWQAARDSPDCESQLDKCRSNLRDKKAAFDWLEAGCELSGHPGVTLPRDWEEKGDYPAGSWSPENINVWCRNKEERLSGGPYRGWSEFRAAQGDARISRQLGSDYSSADGSTGAHHFTAEEVALQRRAAATELGEVQKPAIGSRGGGRRKRTKKTKEKRSKKTKKKRSKKKGPKKKRSKRVRK